MHTAVTARGGGMGRPQMRFDRDEILEQASRARSRRQWRRAISLYRELLALEPNSVELHERLAPLLAQTHQEFDAWNSYRAIAHAALREGRRKVGIIGTKYTMNGPVYPGALGRRGLEWAVPEADDQRLINDVIFDELCLGVFKEESRSAYAAIIGKLRDKGCDAVALVCTEIPLLVTPGVSPLPTLDSTRLLASAALTRAIGETRTSRSH